MEHIDLKVIHTDKSYIGKKVTVCGWVRTSRDSKNVAFVELNDGSQLEHVQVVFEKSLFADATLAPMLALGAALQV
ncbi:MAG: OB-fold nucleic acid binding domain-containing protein, partial [Clostridia bacterium]|nr:OB-fold nucleic acid binding domain-containing protein [Clostridia bacterium]